MMARPRGPTRSNKTIATAVRRYMADEPVDDIASDLNVTQPTVSYWMKHHGKKFGGKTFKLRKQGRRKATVPNARDKELIHLHSMGAPITWLAAKYGITRSRAGYIVVTWRNKGYEPPPPTFKVGDLVRVDQVDYGAVYELTHVYDSKSGRAKLVQERINQQWLPVDDQVICDPLVFFKDGKMAEVIKPLLDAQEVACQAA